MLTGEVMTTLAKCSHPNVANFALAASSSHRSREPRYATLSANAAIVSSANVAMVAGVEISAHLARHLSIDLRPEGVAAAGSAIGVVGSGVVLNSGIRFAPGRRFDSVR